MADAPELRFFGKLTLVCGALIAAVVYLVQAQSVAVDQAAQGYSRAQEHQMKALMGPLAVAMSGWADALMSPAGQAIMIAAFAAFIAYMCFRHARLAEEEE